ncbi:MAG: hypothetical protein GX422_00045 [Deltaproteobacteria bacterium]|nr:hypothetical protein [Deltaproteobacteria bacterium]
MTSRREPGKALIFTVDEVGQYVSRSVDKMLDLQAVVQSLGKEGVKRVKEKCRTNKSYAIAHGLEP